MRIHKKKEKNLVTWSNLGASSIEYVIIFTIVALLLTVLYQTWYYVRVKSVVTHAAEQAARSYAENATQPDRTTRAKTDAVRTVQANLPIGSYQGKYYIHTIPPGWIKGIVSKQNNEEYLIGFVKARPANPSIQALLDRYLGQEVAAKLDATEDESVKKELRNAIFYDELPKGVRGTILSETTDNNQIRGEISGNNDDSRAIYPFSFTGNDVNWVVPNSGKYKLEVWGAQGAGTSGGKGGYSAGERNFNAGDTLYIYIGGRNGWNGGGTGGYNGGGGTDIRFGGRQLSNRIIVAGGGGGQSNGGKAGGAGGGLIGGNGSGSYGGPGGGASQTGGGKAWIEKTASYPGTTLGGTGSLGKGGDGAYAGTSIYAGGGGGGYYGGAGGSTDYPGYSDNDDFGGGGGSGYIGGVENGETYSGINEGNGRAVITFLGAPKVDWSTQNTFPQTFRVNERKKVDLTLSNLEKLRSWNHARLLVDWISNGQRIKRETFTIGSLSPGSSKSLSIDVQAPDRSGLYTVVYRLEDDGTISNRIQTFNNIHVLDNSLPVLWDENNSVPSPLELNRDQSITIRLFNKSSYTWTPNETNIVVEWQGTQIFSSSYPLPQSVAPGGELTLSVTFPPKEITQGAYRIIYKLRHNGMWGNQSQIFEPINVQRKITLTRLGDTQLPVFAEPGEPLKGLIQFKRDDFNSDITLREQNFVLQYRVGSQIKYEYHLKLPKPTIVPGEIVYLEAELPTPSEQGVYDVVLLAKPTTGQPEFISTEIRFNNISIGVLPKQSVITGVQEFESKTINVESNFVTVQFKEDKNLVEAEVIYHAPLLWNFGRFFSSIPQPIWDIKGKSVMRLEKPLFGSDDRK